MTPISDFAARLVYRGERHRQERRVVHIVDAHNPHIARNAHTLRQQGLHPVRRHAVVGADEGIARASLRVPLQGPIRPFREYVAGAAEIREGILISADADLHGRRVALQAHEAYAPRAQSQQVFRRQIAGAMIVDTHQIGGALFG
jgi:hypothetical protein